jgi:hypothetical protein
MATVKHIVSYGLPIDAKADDGETQTIDTTKQALLVTLALPADPKAIGGSEAHSRG